MGKTKVGQSGKFGIYVNTLAFHALRRAYPAITKLAPTPPHARLSVISRHLDPRPPIPVNTPYSVERASSTQSIPAQVRRNSSSSQTSEKAAMSNQPNHPALLIPGPIEFDDAVLQSMSHYSESCWSAFRCHFRRDPFHATKAFPDDRPILSAIRHFWLRYSRLGLGSGKFGRAWRRCFGAPHWILRRLVL